MAQKKIEIIIDIDNKDIQFATDKTLTLTQQIRLLKAELQKTKEGTKEFEILRNKLNETQDQFARVNAKSRELFGTLSLIPGPIGEIAGKVNGAISLLKTFSGFSFAELKSQFGGLLSDIKGILIQLGSWGESTQQLSQSNQQLSNSNEDLGSAFESVGDSAADSGAQIQRNLATTKQSIQTQSDKIKKIEENITVEKNYRDILKQQKTDLESQIQIGKEGTKQNIARRKEIDAINVELSNSRDREQKLNAEIVKTVAASNAATTAIESQTLATRAATVAATAGTAAFRILKGVLASLGIGLLIVGITTLGTKIYDWITATDRADEANQKLTETLDMLQRSLDQTQVGIQEETKLLVTRAKTAGQTADEIAQIELKSIDKRIAANKKGRELLEQEGERIQVATRITEEQRAELIKKNEELIVANSQEYTNLIVEQRQALADEELRIAEKTKKDLEKNENDKKNRREKDLENRKKELEELKQIQREADLTLMAAKDREIAIINDKYNKQIALANKYKQDTKDIEAARQKEIGEINDKYNKIDLDKTISRLDAEIELEKNKGEQGIATSKEVLQRLYDEKLAIELRNIDLSESEKEALRQKYARELEDEIKNDIKTINDLREQQLVEDLQKNRGNFDEQIRLLEEFQQQVIKSENYNGGEKLRIIEETNQKIIQAQADRFQKEKDDIDLALFDFKLNYEEYYNAQDALYVKEAERYRLLHEQKKITDAEYLKFLKENIQARNQLAQTEAENRAKFAGAIGQSLQALSGIVGEQTKAGKALAVAASLINTYASIAGQLAAFAGVPIPGYAIAQAIATGLVGFKAVRDILKTPVPGEGEGAGGGAQFNTGTIRVRSRARGGIVNGPGTSISDSIPTMLSDGEYVVNARSTRMFQPLLQKINSFGNDIPKFQMGGLVMGAQTQNGNDGNISLTDAIEQTLRREPIRTYVTSTEMSNQQQFDRIIKSRSLI